MYWFEDSFRWPFTVICFCNISVALKSNVAASMSSFFISVENLKSKRCCAVQREVRVSCTLRQQPSSNTTFPQTRRSRWDGSVCSRCASVSGWDARRHHWLNSQHTHTVLQSTQSHPLAEFSAVLPSVLIPIILLIRRSRPLKRCVQPQQSQGFHW